MKPRNPPGLTAATENILGHKRLSVFAILAAVALLATLLSLSTLGNLDREEDLMARFLQEKGLTVIRSFEAGIRAAMLSTVSESSALETLVREIAKAESVAYVRVVDEFERRLAEAGPEAGRVKTRPAEEILAAGVAATRIIAEPGGGRDFEVARELRPVEASRDDPCSEVMRGRWQQWCSMGPRGSARRRSVGTAERGACRQTITAEFDAARRQDICTSLLFAGILLLAGGAG